MQGKNTPYGLCECGCGQETRRWPKNDRHQGRVKGEPARYIKGHRKPVPFEKRYVAEDRGHESPCWIWLRNVGSDGYGVVQEVGSRRKLKAHRVSYEMANGPIPEGMQLDHLCRVRACVNPAHLEPVTNTENVLRGRSTKLTFAQVIAIRNDPRTHPEIAADYVVTASHVSAIKNMKTRVAA